MLTFIGRGSAFNSVEGNNGGYIIKGDEMFMVDCGSSTFAHMQEQKLLDGIKHVHVLMTHTHPDHIGSLGDLVLFGYYSMGEFKTPGVTVYAPAELRMMEYFPFVGVTPETYVLKTLKQGTRETCTQFGLTFEPIVVEHVAELTCFGYIFEIEDGSKVYYSGDTNEIPERVLAMLKNGEFKVFYQDVCKADYPGNVHLSLREIEELIPTEMRSIVYCMHLDGTFNEKEAESKGFQVVKL